MPTMYAVLQLIFCILLFAPCAASGGHVNVSEIKALKDLYDNTDGDRWNWDSHANNGFDTHVVWNFTISEDGNYLSNPCIDKWIGVDCTPLVGEESSFDECSVDSLFNCTITALSLENMNITGLIPSSVGSELRYLNTLDLSHNQITGSIPKEIFAMPNLRTLMVSSNCLKYALDDSMCSAVNLYDLELSGNSIFGTIPTCINSLTNLFELSLQFNELVGPIPETISDLTSLIGLNLGNNRLTASLPSNIGNMSSLQSLTVCNNRLTGQLCESLYSMQLSTLSLDSNRFEMSISASICDMTHLKELQLSHNLLYGSLPDCIAGMPSLYALEVGENFLEGPLPVVRGEYLRISTMCMGGNAFTGSIPSEYLSSDRLQSLNLTGNRLSGTLPEISNSSSLISLELKCNHDLHGELPFMGKNLITLKLGDNKFSSSIPSALSSLPYALYIDLADNEFSGSFPNIVRSMGLLQLEIQNNHFSGRLPLVGDVHPVMWGLDVSMNLFTGPLPPTLFNWNAMTILNFSYNFFDGELPAFKESGGLLMSRLNYLDVGHNQLTGTIPEDIYRCNSLFEFNTFENMLHGTIPSSLGTMQLYMLKIDNNRISGTIPATFSTMHSIRTLMLYSNYLSGRLDDMFSCTTQYELAAIDVSDNNFNGPIPKQVFSLTMLKSLSLAMNCFTGRLPDEICDADGLEVLDFDGLTSGKGCTGSEASVIRKMTGNRFFYISKSLEGTIPGCLFGLSNLTQVYLSGNGIGGKIPHITDPESSSLTSLALSNNRLSGTIPREFQRLPKLSALHLSYNRLAGTIDSMNYSRLLGNQRVSGDDPSNDIVAETTVSLNNNRLSGPIPIEFTRGYDVNILAGNLFSCNAAADLPDSDPEKSHYICGSTVLDISMYILVGYVAAFVIALTSWKYMVDYHADKADARKSGSSRRRRDTMGSIRESIRESIVLQYSEAYIRQSIGGMLITPGKGRKSTPGNDNSSVDIPSKGDLTPHSVRGGGTGNINSNSVRSSNSHIHVPTLDAANESHTVDRSVIIDGVETETTHAHVTKDGFVINDDDGHVIDRLSGVTMQAYNRCSDMRRLFGLYLVLRRFSIFVAVFAIFVFLPIYLILKMSDSDNSSHTYQYSWYISGAYLEGETAGIALTVAWGVLSIFVFVAVLMMNKPVRLSKGTQHYSGNSIGMTTSGENTPRESVRISNMNGGDGNDSVSLLTKSSSNGVTNEEKRGLWNSVSKGFYLTIATIVNCVAILLLNLFYVYVSLRANTFWTWATIMFVAMCKTVWNVKIIPLMLIQASLANGDTSIRSGKMAVLQSIWIMFNNVVAPLVATLSMDSSCYLSLFVAPDPITTNYVFPVCESFNTTSGVCVDEIVIGGANMEFHPPFIYSCQCSSSLLIKYVPLYIIVYGFTGIILPTFQIIMLDVLERITVYREKIESSLVREASEEASGIGGEAARECHSFNARMVVYWNIRRVATATLGLIPPFMWPIRAVIAQGLVDKTVEQSMLKAQATSEENDVDTALHRREHPHRLSVAESVSSLSMSALKFYARNRNLYKFQSITCNVIASLAVLLTFGIAYPPLAVLISVYICSTTSILHLTVTRHLQQCPSSYLDGLISRIKRESNGLLNVLYKSAWVLIIFMCGFVSCFTIDQTESASLAFINVSLGGLILVILFVSRSDVGLECYTCLYDRNSHCSSDPSQMESLLSKSDRQTENEVSLSSSSSCSPPSTGTHTDTDYYEEFDYDGDEA